jgi:long-chain acyl-CoA synthetase
MRVEEFLRRSAAAAPAKTALVAGSKRLSYLELDDLSDRLAGALLARGLSRGDRVLVFMENIWEAAVAIFAVLKAGAVFCPVNPSTKAAGLAFVARHCGARIILTQYKFGATVSEAARKATGLDTVIATGVYSNSLSADAVAFGACIEGVSGPLPSQGIDVDLAMLIYTSGSTGRPKGVMMTHRSIEAAAESIIDYLQNSSNDIILNALPLSFNYGLYQLITSIRVGATLILEKSFAFPHLVFETMRTEGVTVLPLVPTMAAMILGMKDLEPASVPALRCMTNAAAALPSTQIARLRKLFPSVRFFSMYGQTECARGTWLSPDEIDRRPDSVGKAIPNTEAFIVDDAGLPVGPNIIGELVIRGPHLMQGYWDDAEATAALLRPAANGWERVLHTGDLFRSDEDGFLYFISRKDDIIKTRGEKVAPKEVEAALYDCSGITEAVVVGVPHPILGSAIHAVVVRSDPALTARDIIRHCARHLPEFMVPKLIEFRSELPKTPSGKISRRLVAATMEPAP